LRLDKMKLLSVLICGTLVAVLLAQSEEFDSVLVEGSGSDSTATTPSNTESPSVPESTSGGGDKPTVSGSTQLPETGSTGPTLEPVTQNIVPSKEPVTQGTEPAGPTELPESTTTETPVDRQVSFRVDCSQGDQCDFTFKIAEQLMRYVNTTYLEELLGQLTVKIQKISAEVGQLTTEEASYETLLTNKLDELLENVQGTFENVTKITDTVDELQTESDSIEVKAQHFYAAALCFQNNADTSENCGAIAFQGTTTDSW